MSFKDKMSLAFGLKPIQQLPDGPLQPHRFETEVSLIGQRLPCVLITPQAYKCMSLYVDIADKEVGWMGLVSVTDEGDFLIEETFLLEQEVSATETELAAEDIGRLTMSLIGSGQGGLDRANKLRFWGHSHVRMDTGPSMTDERTMARFGSEGMPWYVRGIFNKLGVAQFTIYLFDRGIEIYDARWALWDPETKKVLFMDRPRMGFKVTTRPDTCPLTGKPIASNAELLQPGAELRADIEAEFKAKVKVKQWPKFLDFLLPAGPVAPPVTPAIEVEHSPSPAGKAVVSTCQPGEAADGGLSSPYQPEDIQ